MNKHEFVTSVVFNKQLVNVGIDDNGQTYFIEYTDKDGKLVEACVGSYETDYMYFIEHTLAPDIITKDLCEHVSDQPRWNCSYAESHGFCYCCPNNYSKEDWEFRQSQQAKLTQVLEEYMKRYEEN